MIEEVGSPARYQAATAQVARLALEEAPLDQLLNSATAVVAETLGVEFCKILEHEPDGRRLVLRAGVGWREDLVGEVVIPASSETHAGHTLLSRTPVVVEDFRNEPRFRPSLLHRHDAVSGAAVVIPGAAPFGVLGVHTKSRRSFSQSEVTFLETVAAILARAVQRNRTQQTVIASEERFRRTFEDSPVGMTIVGPDHRFLRANRVFCELMEFSEDELQKLKLEQITHPDDLASTVELAEKLFGGEITRFQLVTRHVKKSGAAVQVNLTLNLVSDDRGRPLHAVSMIEDLSTRVRREEDLQLARFTLDHAKEAIFWAGPEGRFENANESAQRMLGYSHEELLALSVTDLDENVRAEDWPGMWKRLSERGALSLETRLRPKSGDRIPVDLTINHLALGETEYACAFVREISGRKRAEEELRASEERYRNLFENAGATVWMLDLAGNVVSLNRTGELFTGYSREELAGKHIAGILPPDQRDIVSRMIEKKLADGGTTTYELEILARDGRRRPLQITSRLVQENGAAVGIQGIGIDISTQRKAQGALRRSEEYFRALIENTQDLITILDKEGTVRYVSPSVERVLGFPAASRLGKSTFELLHPDDVDAVSSELARGTQVPNATASLVFRTRAKDGSWRHLEAVARNLLDNPAVKGVVVNSRDITRRVRAEEKIRASEEWFRSSFDNAGVPTAITAVDGVFLRVNPALCSFLGRPESELLQLTFADITHPDDIGLSHAMRQRLLRGKEPIVELEKRYIRKDGHIVWGYLTLSLIHDAERRPDRIAAQIVNITERKEAEAALRQSELRFRLAAESASEFIYEWDVAGDRIEWHGDVDRCLGYRRGQFPRTGTAWRGSIHPDDRGQVMQAIETTLADGAQPPDIEYRIRTKKGDYRYWLTRGRCVRDEAGRPYKWIGACSDITMRKQTEHALRRSEAELLTSQKELRALAARLLGNEEEEHRRLARELHDDFNQRLTAVAFQLAQTQESLSPDIASAATEKLRGARDEIARLSDDMRRLAHQLHPAAIDLLGLPAALRQQCQEASYRGQIEVRFSGRNLPQSFPNDISLCLYRITQESLRNALKHAGADKVLVTLSGASRGVRLSVKDNGRGFAPATAESKGGMGLISMTERARLVGGRLKIESSPGKGAKIVVEAPLADQITPAERNSAPGAGRPTTNRMLH